MSVAASDSILGLVLEGKYRVIREVGRGGMGVVYEAEHAQLGKRVAIKLMLEKYSEDTEAIARFQREAFAASRIGDPHIIDVTDIGIAPDGRSFVVMELLAKGMSLSAALEERGAMPMWRAIHVMRQVLRAVGAAHAKGIIHRDLKPDNIFLLQHDDQQDFVKLLDFGISKVLDSDEASAATRLTTTGVVIGTPLYMAPEQAMGSPVERFADIYACGVMLYEMLAGRPPFEGQNYAVLIAKVLTSEAPLLSDLRPGLPPKLIAAVHRALEKEPTARFRTAEEFALALPTGKTSSEMELAGTMESGRRPSAPALSTLGSSAGAMVVPPVTRTTAPAPRRAWWPWAAGLGALAAGAIAFAVVATRGSHPGPTQTTGMSGTTAAATGPDPRGGSAISPSGAGSAATGSAARATGSLVVEATPPGATITIDGIPRGTSHIDITLEPGDHPVTITAAGFEAESFLPQVQAGAATRIVVALVPTRAAGAGTPSVTHPAHATTTMTVTRPKPNPARGSATAAPPDPDFDASSDPGGDGGDPIGIPDEIPAPPPVSDPPDPKPEKGKGKGKGKGRGTDDAIRKTNPYGAPLPTPPPKPP